MTTLKLITDVMPWKFKSLGKKNSIRININEQELDNISKKDSEEQYGNELVGTPKKDLEVELIEGNFPLTYEDLYEHSKDKYIFSENENKYELIIKGFDINCISDTLNKYGQGEIEVDVFSEKLTDK